MVEHAGRFYRVPRLQMSPVPPAPIPILVGGASERALRRAARHDGWIGAGNVPDEVPGIVQHLRVLRREMGRDGAPFELIVALAVPPAVDVFRRLEDEGVTGVVSWPFAYTISPTSTLEQKRRALEQYGSGVIARMQ
jgi:alkanesulfonate monooxygenase SsuD/methylene tetrahydromethanopterin reductase-like flavin-dependent oxidoreductase (luciferase family)